MRYYMVLEFFDYSFLENQESADYFLSSVRGIRRMEFCESFEEAKDTRIVYFNTFKW